MKERFGRCLNSDYCALADARAVVRLHPCEPFVCPECAHALAPALRWEHPREAMLVVAGMLTIIGSASLGFVVAHSHAGDQAWMRLAGIGRRAQAAPHGIMPQQPVVLTSTAYSRVRWAVPPSVSPMTYTPEPPMEVILAGSASFTPKPIEVVLRLAGSDSVAEGLATSLAEAFLAQHDTDIETSRIGRDETAIIGTNLQTRDAVLVVASDTASGLGALTRGQTDLAVAGRPLNAAERTALLHHPKTNADTGIAFADVPVAVIVNAANPLAQLNAVQVAAVFGSEAQLTGIERRYASDDLASDAPGPLVSHMRDSRAVADAVAHDPAGMGLVPLHLAGPNRVVAVTGGPALRLAASIIGPGPHAAPAARDFLRFVQSRAGQDAMLAAGFLKPTPLGGSMPKPKLKPAAIIAAAPAPDRTPDPAPEPPDRLDGFDLKSDTTHVFTLPANARMVSGSLADVKLPAAKQTAKDAPPDLPPPSPVNGVMMVNCAIGEDGVPSDCRVITAHGTKSGSAAVLTWLTSGGVRYSPRLQDGKPVAARRDLVVNYRPPGSAP